MEKPTLKLTGIDGNVFLILGRAKRIARRAGWDRAKIACFMNDAQSGNYDHAIKVCMDYFEVE